MVTISVPQFDRTIAIAFDATALNEALSRERILWAQRDDCHVDILLAKRTGDVEATALAEKVEADRSKKWFQAHNDVKRLAREMLIAHSIDIAAFVAVVRQL